MINFNVTTGALLARYVNIGKLPMGTYTAASTLVNSSNAAITINSLVITTIDNQPAIPVVHLVGAVNVLITDSPVRTSSYVPGTYVGDIKFVNIDEPSKVYYSPQYSVTVTRSITP